MGSGEAIVVASAPEAGSRHRLARHVCTGFWPVDPGQFEVGVPPLGGLGAAGTGSAGSGYRRQD